MSRHLVGRFFYVVVGIYLLLALFGAAALTALAFMLAAHAVGR